MSRTLIFSLLATAAAAIGYLPASGPGIASGGANHTSVLTIHLERNRNGQTEPMRTDHVFSTGDVIRFRVTAGRAGYLYVLDQGSSGSYSVLFPASGTSFSNRIEQAKDYTVPATGDGWFAVDPPAGFDIVYFLLSPTPLAPVPAPGGSPAVPAPSATPQPAPAAPLNPALQPRCNDAIFQARGECIDNSAGPAPLPRDAVLPPQITMAAPHASRDIVLVPEEDDTAVTAKSTGNSPVVYTFRLAHR